MRLPTSSKLALAQTCAFPWSHHAPAAPEDVGGASAALGTALHDAAEQMAYGAHGEVVHVDLDAIATKNGLEGADRRALEAMSEHVGRWLEEETFETRLAEVSYAYDPTDDNGGVCGVRRDYSRAPARSFCGTVDLVTLYAGRVKVSDYKTGPRAREHRPRETPQLRLLGLAVARALGLDEIDVELVHVDERGAFPVRDTLDAFDLAAIAGELAELRDAIERPAAPIVPVPGSHCTNGYCTIRGVCPATVAAVQAIALAVEPMAEVLPVVFEDVDQAARARMVVKLVRARCDAIEEGYKALARRASLPVIGAPDMVYGIHDERTDERVELSPAAEAALVEVLGPHVEKAIKRSTSFTAIYDAARAAVAEANMGRPKVKGERRETIKDRDGRAVAALRKVGAIKGGQMRPALGEFRRLPEGEPPLEAFEAADESEGASL